MEIDVLKTAAQVAGIGGLSLGVFFLLFRDLIRKNIFPKFKSEQLAYRLLRLIVVLVWSVALSGMAAWAITTMFDGDGGDTIQVERFSGDLHLADADVIINQYQEYNGAQLDADLIEDIRRAANLAKAGSYEAALPVMQKVAESVPVPALYNNIGVLQAATDKLDAARASFEKAMEKSPENATLNLNLGLLDERQGRVNEALRHFTMASDTKEARRHSERLVEQKKLGLIESEPNNEILSPTRIPLNQWVQAAAGDPGDVDYFVFETPSHSRDIVSIEIENQSTTLRPSLSTFDGNKHAVWRLDTYWVTAGQDVSHSFSVEPGAKYFVQTGGAYQTKGSYRIRVSTREAYDAFESNNDILSAKAIVAGKVVEANIMDAHDADFFQVKISSSAAKLRVKINNTSNSLRPAVSVFNGAKHHLWNNDSYWVTPGEHLEHVLDASPGAVYYVSVQGGNGTHGPYRLTVEEVG